MKARKCPVCSAMMLVYVNPPRLICPRANRHHLFLNNTGRLGKNRKKKR